MTYSPSVRRQDGAVSAGMTLIEVALALALLGLVSTGILAVTSNGVGAWIDSREALLQDRRLSNSSLRLHESIAAIVSMPAIPRSDSLSPFPFFQGERQTMRFVSGHSPMRGSRAGMRLVSLHARRDERGLRLLVTETPCPGPRGLGSLVLPAPSTRANPLAIQFMPVREGKESWIVAENLTVCEFSYLREAPVPNESAEWVQRWPDRSALPRAIRIEWAGGSRQRGNPLSGRRSLTAAVLAESEPAGGLSGWH